MLDEHFPGMKQQYIRSFENAYEISSPDQQALMELITDKCRTHGIVYGAEKIFDYMRFFEDKGEGEQIRLPI